MNNNLITSAFFAKEKNENSFYSDLFFELKKEFDFLFAALFYKKGRTYELNYKTAFSDLFKNYSPNLKKKEEGIYKLKIPIKFQNSTAGYFLFIKDSPFKKEETRKINSLKEIYINKIKDFEISKIFQNQLLILQDAIVEKNRATKLLEEQNEKLIETDKIRSEFLANVSHELRTPLNSIIGFSTALKDEMAGPLNEKQKNCANKILSSAIHLTGLINDILDMTKIESKGMKLNLKPENPVSVIKEVLNIIEPLALEKGIKIETDFGFQGEILLDYIKFRQIMYNLTGNAIKFSHKNSKIIISTAKKNNKILIKVQDFGIGIDKKDHKRIFEKFVQLDNVYTKTYSSTGLGLTITNELVKMHGGKINLNSDLNKGTVFTLEFKN